MFLRTFALLALTLTAAACGSSTTSGPSDPADQTYAPSLNVDLATMTKTQSGLYLKDLVVGAGERAINGKRVTVHYTGWLPDGTKFDSSRDRNQAFTFTLGAGQVIRGWDEGVLLMKVGGRRQLVIPSGLGYGSSGSGSIPPNSTLVFDVEVLGVQ